MQNVLSSAAEAECFFNNTKDAVPLCISLTKMGYPHPPTLLDLSMNKSNNNNKVNGDVFLLN
jgi:hypothetical protein